MTLVVPSGCWPMTRVASPAAMTRVACCVSAEADWPRLTRPSSSAIPFADENRSAGSLASARMTTCSIAGETSRLRRFSGGGVSETCFMAMSTADSPVNGRSPHSIS